MRNVDFDFEDDNSLPSRPSLEEVLAALTADDAIPSTDLLYGLSDLTDADIERLQPAYRQLDTGYRRILMQMLVDVSENNYELDYENIGLMGLSDRDAEVRRTAIEVLNEYDSTYVMNRLMKLAQTDSVPEVRADATRALGRFVLAGELGDISSSNFERVQQCVLDILNREDEAVAVRCRALEALANSSHDAVIPAIETAYGSGEAQWRTSAVTAMGNTADERWEAIVLKELQSGSRAMQNEAARSAGELQLQEATALIVRLLREGSGETREIAIRALGELGNKEATRALNQALDAAVNAEDDDLTALIENALGTASLASGKLLLLEVEPDD